MAALGTPHHLNLHSNNNTRVDSFGAVWLSYGAAWLSMVRRGSVMVRRGSVSSASACCKAGPSSILGSALQGEGLPTELSSDEEMERGPSEWRRINVLHECDGMNVCML